MPDLLLSITYRSGNISRSQRGFSRGKMVIVWEDQRNSEGTETMTDADLTLKYPITEENIPSWKK